MKEQKVREKREVVTIDLPRWIQGGAAAILGIGAPIDAVWNGMLQSSIPHLLMDAGIGWWAYEMAKGYQFDVRLRPLRESLNRGVEKIKSSLED